MIVPSPGLGPRLGVLPSAALVAGDRALNAAAPAHLVDIAAQGREFLPGLRVVSTVPRSSAPAPCTATKALGRD